jgi:hypothetical protein
MRRVLATLLLGWVLALVWTASAMAAEEPDPGNPPDWCFQSNADTNPPTCSFYDGEWHQSDTTAGGGGTGGFALIAVLVLMAGAVVTVYKVSMARDMARKSGMDAGQATAMTLLTDDGLEATYLASSLRGSSPTGHPPEQDQDTSSGSGSVGRTVSERLAELEQLREQGLVTQAEYDERRTAILSTL